MTGSASCPTDTARSIRGTFLTGGPHNKDDSVLGSYSGDLKLGWVGFFEGFRSRRHFTLRTNSAWCRDSAGMTDDVGKLAAVFGNRTKALPIHPCWGLSVFRRHVPALRFLC